MAQATIPSVAVPTAGSSQEINPSDFINFLRKRGYRLTENAFRNEVQASKQSANALALKSEVELENPNQISNFIANYPASSETIDPKNYFKQYSAFREWIFASLDMYQQELISLLYPVFVHCYLDLLSKNIFKEDAERFYRQFFKEHEEYHEDEIHRLQSIKTADQLKENELAINFRKHQFAVEISRFSFELMLSFLHDKNHLIVLAILNRRVHFRIINARPTPTGGIIQYNPPSGKSEVEKKEINSKNLYWGLYDEQIPKSKENDMEISDSEDKKKGKKESKPKPEVKKTEKSSVKLPPLSDRLESEYLEDLSNRMKVDNVSLPSVCFYTTFHTYEGMNHIEIAPDASWVAGCFADSSVRLWDVKKKGRREEDDCTVLRGHSGPVFNASFSPDSQWLLTCSEDKSVRLWNTQTKTNLVCYKSHNYPVWSVDFSSVGYYFATSSHDRTARLWSTDQVNPLRVFAGHLSDVNCVKFHPNCNYIATGSSDKSIRLWDINSSGPVRIFTGHLGSVNVLAISPDGKYLASAADDNLIMLWNLSTSKKMATFTGHKGPIWSLDFSAEGNLLASGGSDETVRLWDVSGNNNADSNTMEETDGSNNGTTSTTSSVSKELIKTLPTKRTPVFQVKFTKRNLLMAAGAYRGVESQAQS